MARDFERGSTQYLTSGGADITAKPITLAAWYNPESFGGFLSNSIMGIIVSGSGSDDGISLYTPAGGALRVEVVGGGGSATATTSTTMSTGTWHHVAGSFGGSTVSAYLDAGGKATGTHTGTIGSVNETNIGFYRGGFGSGYADGVICEAAAWNAALSDDEIKALAGGISPCRVRPGNLQHYWPIFGIHSPEVDYGLSKRTLTVTNAPPQADHGPVASPFAFASWGRSGAADVEEFISPIIGAGFTGIIGG